MPTPRPLRRLSQAERVRVSLTDAGGGLRLPLASRRTLITGLAVGVGFLVVTSVAWQQTVPWRPLLFDAWIHRLTSALRLLWLAGLWVGAAALLAVTVVLLFYRESARLADGRLIHVMRIGLAQVAMEYDLAKVRNLRAVDDGKDRAVVRFDYEHGDHRLGSDMSQAEAAARVKVIQAAVDRLAARRPSQADAAVPGPTPGP